MFIANIVLCMKVVYDVLESYYWIYVCKLF